MKLKNVNKSRDTVPFKSNGSDSLFMESDNEQFALGKEQIATALFLSQKTSNAHKKTKERIPNLDWLAVYQFVMT